MRLIFLTDIDDTFMQTERKCAGDTHMVGAVGRSGSPLSFMTAKQKFLWDLMAQNAAVRIPVTARSKAGLARVALPFNQGAVVNFGATILTSENKVDREWRSEMRKEAAALDALGAFDAIEDIVAARHVLSKCEKAVPDGVPAFLNFRTAAGAAHAELLQHIRLLMLDTLHQFHLHFTDRDVTILPRYVDKSHAVAHLVERSGWETDLVVCAGDSLSDLGFMQAGDFLMVPSQSRLSAAASTVALKEGASI